MFCRYSATRSTLDFASVTMMVPAMRLMASLPPGESRLLSCSSHSSQNLMLSDLLMLTLVESPPPDVPPAALAPADGGAPTLPLAPLPEPELTLAVVVPLPVRFRRR